MSVENVVKFYDEVMKNGQLKGKLKDVNEKTLTKEVFESKVLPEAKAKGYDFSYADVQEYYKKQGEKSELNMDELENVSGGSGCKDEAREATATCNVGSYWKDDSVTDSDLASKQVCGSCRHRIHSGSKFKCAVKQ